MITDSGAYHWLTRPHDYSWIINHHSMQRLHRPIRTVCAVSIALFAACSVLLLLSSDGPSGTAAVTWTLIVLVLQIAAVIIIGFLPIPRTNKNARLYCLGFAIFGDVGLASVLSLYSPIVAAFGCALFALVSAIYTYFLSSRWLLAHIAWSAAFIAYTGHRLNDTREFDFHATLAGGLVMFGAVCAVPIGAHVAWTVLSIDARQSLLDPLTGLCNRRGIEVSRTQMWDFALADDGAVAAVVIDVDDFKSVNDTYGHDVGDLVLQQISDFLGGMSEPRSVAGRTGGEEFTVILAGQTGDIEASILTIPDRLARASEAATITASVGAAVIAVPRDHTVDVAMRQALRTADARMYDAKRSGGGHARISTI